jgi:hypothetical protein
MTSIERADKELRFPVLVRILAHFFSYVLHPLFIPVYAALYITFIHPSFFTGVPNTAKYWVVLRVFSNMVMFPFIVVMLLKAVGFIDSIFLKKQKDRIIPYIASGIFYFWMFQLCRNQELIPRIFTSFVFAVFLSSSAALIANIYFKISMHTIGMGGLVGFLLVVLFSTHSAVGVTSALMISILLAGIVGTSRLIVSDHLPGDIYSGFLLGGVLQLISAMIFL